MTKARDIASATPAPSTVSSTELGYLDGVTSAIQTQIDGKQAVNANVSTTELGYLDGVTSAIQTQLDGKIAKTLTTTTGDIIYASSANTPARLGIGSSGQVLTVASGIPSWAAAAGGGGLVYINTLSITTAALSGSIDSVFSSTYDNYFITGTIDSMAGQGNITIKLRSGGSDTSSNYYSGRFYVNNEGYGFNIDSSGTDEWEVLGDGTGSSSADKGAFNIWLYYPNKAEKTRYNSTSTSWDNQGEPQTQLGHGVQNDTTQFTGIKFISSVNMTGVFTIYGFAKS